MVNTFKSLIQFNTIRFSAYRTAMKIRELQKKLSRKALAIFCQRSAMREAFKWEKLEIHFLKMSDLLEVRSVVVKRKGNIFIFLWLFQIDIFRHFHMKVSLMHTIKYAMPLSTLMIFFSSFALPECGDWSLWCSRIKGPEWADAWCLGYCGHSEQSIWNYLGRFIFENQNPLLCLFALVKLGI